MAIQQRLNIFEGEATTLAVCEQFDLASINRSPLEMGLLTGVFTAETQIPADWRTNETPCFAISGCKLAL
jgi:aryl-alcohol dehydrogenase-like predicted oxidoreductase